MAVKRIRTKKTVLPEPMEVTETPPEVQEAPKKKVSGWVIGVILAVILVGFFWYKTNSWPIVAMVGMRPITRFEVDQALFKQGGKTQVEDIITQTLIENELKKNNINISSAEVESKINDIKAQLGKTTKIEDVLAQRGMTMDDFKKQLALQMGIEQLLKNKVTVTDQEIADYITQNKQYMSSATPEAQKAEATQAVQMNKLQTEVNNWITQLRNASKIWRAPGV